MFYNDDTTLRIGAVRQQIQSEAKANRIGIFTTGIVCEGGSTTPSVRMLFTGHRHADKNLAQVLKERETGLATPLQRCDGRERNHPEGHATELCHCLVHARRQFIEIPAVFPSECERVVETIGVIYRVEAECRKVEPNSELDGAIKYLQKRWTQLTQFR